MFLRLMLTPRCSKLLRLLISAAFIFFASCAVVVGQRAIVADERLAALRSEPSLSAPLLRRLSRGRRVSIVGPPRRADGISFYRVAVTRRTRGWIAADSLCVPSRPREDERLLQLIQVSEDFEQLARAHIFLEAFPRSTLRPVVLLLLGEEAERAAEKLTREAVRRLNEEKLGDAPLHAYFLNYSGLDRFNRLGIRFAFDAQAKKFQYDGESWREIVRRYPRSPEAARARQLLSSPRGGIKE